MRTRWLALIPLLAACDDPVAPPVVEPPEPQCEAGIATLAVPTASAVVVASAATYQDVRLVCQQNGTTGTVEVRYRVAILEGNSATDEVPWTGWSDDMPTVRVTRHAFRQKALIWDVRVGEALSTSLLIVQP